MAEYTASVCLSLFRIHTSKHAHEKHKQKLPLIANFSPHVKWKSWSHSGIASY